MDQAEKIGNYIISQRIKYLAYGLIAGFVIGLSPKPFSYITIVIFVVLAIILSYWHSRKAK